MTLAARWYDAQAMAARAEQWRDLAARAVEPNVFAQADYVLPALAHLGGAGVRILAIEEDGRLLGLMPVRLSRWRWGLPFCLAVHHLPYTPHGTVLVDVGRAEATCSAMIAALAAMPQAPRALLMPQVDESGAFAAAWAAAARASGRTVKAFEPYARPALVPDAGAARMGYVAARFAKERRRRLEALPRRIDREVGPLEITVARTPGDVAEALETFMAVEASGWKGRRGTAIGARDHTAAFFRESMGALASTGSAEIVTMRVPDGPVAVALLARADGRVWFYKTAYDERFARYSPGFALDLVVTDHLLADPTVTLGDSLVSEPNIRFERLWRERLPMADWLTEIDASRGGFGAAIVRLETARRAARGHAKRAVNWARDRLGR